jgi:peptidoglycan/xylan/chitin deacetylase (PgdA/CDA1 family)
MKLKHILIGIITCLILAWGAMPCRAAGEGPINTIPTTYQGVVFAFGGLSQPAVVDDILQRMDKQGMRGTFFVTERELRTNPESVADIVRYGQEIGIGLRPGDAPERAKIEAQIARIRKRLAAYGVHPVYVRQMYGAESDVVNQVCKEQNLIMIGQTRNIVLSRLKDASSSDEIMNAIFKKWDKSIGRGQIMYFRLDYLSNPHLIGEVMDRVKKEKVDSNAFRTPFDSPETNPANDSAYRVVSVGDIMAHKDLLWEKEPDIASLPPELQPDYIEAPVTDKNFNETFLQRYIGAPEVDEEDRMYGFDRDVIRKADKTGVVKTVNDNTIFLTFDDWGTDNTINQLLYVLRKHHATATFFIITRYMPNNPNLLRAIALSGNSIGSHTDLHRPMAIRNEKGDIEYPLDDQTYMENVVSAYRKLAEVVGNIQVNDRYALTRLFRPPTLAVSESGSRDVLNAGYTYLVSGYQSTEDYAVPSLAYLVGAIRHGIYRPDGKVRRGSIIIMHMSATAKYTPEALDIVLTENERLSDNDPKKFKVGYLSDYLRDGYDQRMEQPAY